MKISILSGHTDIGGSTVAFINLTNLLNDNGFDVTFYGSSDWPKGQCRYKHISEYISKQDNVVIYHFMALKKGDLSEKKQILSCHETTYFNINRIQPYYTGLHLVSEFQKEWQKVSGIVIPNVINPNLKKYDKKGNIAGVIGSIDKNKRTALSIERALNEGMMQVQVWGKITDFSYFQEHVLPRLGRLTHAFGVPKVVYCGITEDMNAVYRNINHVYHSPQLETYNLIKFECNVTGTIYHGLEGNDTKAEQWDNQKIVEAWRKLIEQS